MQLPEVEKQTGLVSRAYGLAQDLGSEVLEFAKNITPRKAAAALATGTLALGGIGEATFALGDTTAAYADGSTGATGTTGSTEVSGSSNPLAADVDTSSPNPNCPNGTPGQTTYWCRNWDTDYQVQHCQQNVTSTQYGELIYFIASRQAVDRKGGNKVKVDVKLERPLIGIGNSTEECAEVTDNSLELQLAIAEPHSGSLELKDLKPIGQPTKPIFGDNSVVYDGNPHALTDERISLSITTKAGRTALRKHKLYTIYTVNSYPLIQIPCPQYDVDGPMTDQHQSIFSKVIR